MRRGRPTTCPHCGYPLMSRAYPCTVPGCNEPRHVTAGGLPRPRCRAHEAERSLDSWHAKHPEARRRVPA